MLSAADKVDNLTVAFALGERPTGSRDPYGLRRADRPVPPRGGGRARDRHPAAGRTRRRASEGAGRRAARGAGGHPRLRARAPGGTARCSSRVRAGGASRCCVGLGAVAQLAQTLAASATSDQFERAYIAYDRANRLAGRADGAAPSLDPKLATDEAELALIAALESASPRIEAAVQAREFEQALAAF